MQAHAACPSEPERWRVTVAPEASQRLASAIERLAKFPVLDGTVVRVLAVADDPESTTAELVSVLECDPAFAANLLRLANSAAMARPLRAETVRQAVMLVGRKGLRRLALETATYNFLELAPGGGGTMRGELHLHAVTTAAVASGAAAMVGGDVSPETAHLAGLLHDLGRVVLPLAFGPGMCDEVAALAPHDADRTVAERDVLGVDHAQAGARLAERWRLPQDVVAAIAWHHGGPTGIAGSSPLDVCVQLADQVAELTTRGPVDHALVQAALHRAGLEPSALDALAEHGAPASLEPAPPGTYARRATDVEGLPRVDDATGLATRRHWLQSTREALLAAGRGAAVVLCTLDGLPPAHRPGLAITDIALAEAGRVLPAYGAGGRLGHSRLGIWCPAGAADPVALRRRVHEDLRAALGGRPETAPVGVRVACVPVPRSDRDLAVLLQEAAQELAAAGEPHPATTVSSPRAVTSSPSSVL